MCICLSVVFFSLNSHAISIISDLEIEDFINEVIRPIFEAAEIKKKNTKTYIIQDENVNAFVYNYDVFVHTGLIAFADKSDVLFGVLAHETGHLTAKHLTRMVIKSQDNMENITPLALVSAILLLGLSPAAAAVLAPAAILGPVATLSALMQNKLKYSRENENEADHLAIQYLKAINKSIDGLYSTMMFFDQNMSKNIAVYKYFLTHPLPSERLDVLRLSDLSSSNSIAKFDKKSCEIEYKFRRSKAKVIGFLVGNFDVRTSIIDPHPCFSPQDLAFFHDYQVIHELWKDKQYNEAIAKLEKLNKENKKDIFILDTMANIYFADQKVHKAISVYREILKIKNNSAIQLNFARYLTISNDIAHVREGIRILKQLKFNEPENPIYYSQLAIAYIQLNDPINSNIYNAYAHLLSHNCAEARSLAEKTKLQLQKIKNKDTRKMTDNINDILDACPVKKKGRRKKR